MGKILNQNSNKASNYILFKNSIILLLIFLSLSNFAQDSIPIDQMDWKDLVNIKVTSAGKKEQFIKDAPANIIVVTSKQIENRGYLTLQEVFKDLPGFDFAVGLPSGEYPTHFLFRGTGDVGQTKFALYVDGILQNDISNGWFRHVGYNFSLANIERIELVSGPGSALYGSNAFAGFVNIITKERYNIKDKRFQATSNSFVGLNNTVHQDFNGWLKFKNETSLSFTGRYFQTNGDNGQGRFDPGNYFNNNHEPDSVRLLNGGSLGNTLFNGRKKPLNDGFNTGINDYYFRTRINNKNLDLSASHWRKTEGLGSYVVGYEYFTNDDSKDFKANHLGHSFEMKYSFSPSLKTKSTTRSYFITQKVLPETGFSYTYKFQDVQSNDSVVPNYKKSYESEGYLMGLEQQIDIKHGARHHLIFGVQLEQKIREFFNIRYITDSSKSTLSSINQSIDLRPVFFSVNGAVFAQEEYLISTNLLLTAGFRYDYDEFYGGIFNPRIALVSRKREGMNFKLLFGQGFKAPTIFELYDEWRGNSALLPEVIQTSELEFSYTKTNLNLTLNMFANNLYNSILVQENLDTISNPIGKEGQKAELYQNNGESAIIGYSLRGAWAPFKEFYFSGNYHYLVNNNLKSVDNVAMHKLNFSMNYFLLSKLNINVRGNCVGKIKAPASNLYFYEKTAQSVSDVGYDYVVEDDADGYLDGHFLMHLTLTGKNLITLKTFQLEPFIKLNNIFNVRYAYIGRQSGSGVRPESSIQSTVFNPNGFIPAYHPQQGTMLMVGFRLKFL